ncbi:PIN domain-containing protein [Spirosoma telluris]|uniref:PIN domain-containing protein n=1 Tax=Spirosoma telluris TaxID=2183553 RepID=UPI0012F8F5C1
MIYFDTDVLVNFFVEQEATKHQLAGQLIKQATDQGLFFISTHSLNELVFALAKCRMTRDEIIENVSGLYVSEPVDVTVAHFKRATEIAYKVSFFHGSDCLHTAIAEQYCNELYTFNRSDFQLIQHHTKLKITIL